MKLRQLLFVCSTFFALWSTAQVSVAPNGGNQKSVTRQYLGSVAFVEIQYSSPDVAGRENLWGTVVPNGLNPFGFGNSTADNPSPWRAGANENTTIEISHDAKIDGKDLPAGKYGFHVITQAEGPWTLIFVSETEAWGSFFYHPDQDVLRTEATPEETEFTEYLTYEFTNRKVDQTTVSLIWEKKKVSFTIEIPNNNDIMMTQIESELKGPKGFNFASWVQAANWASGAGYHDKALAWAENAITAPFIGQRNYTTISTKATVLFAKGDVDEAVAAMDEAIADPSATSGQIHQYGRRLVAQDMDEKALEVFKLNHKKFEGAWPTNYGLARGYSAVGNYKQALKYMKLAKENVPSGDTVNPPLIEDNIKKLENGEDIN